VVDFLIEFVPESEASKSFWKVLNFPIEGGLEDKDFERRGKVVHKLIEACAQCE
jgi:hypothetical protein